MPQVAKIDGECVDHERRVEVLQVSRTDDDRRDQQAGRHGCPGAGAKLLSADTTVGVPLRAQLSVAGQQKPSD